MNTNELLLNKDVLKKVSENGIQRIEKRNIVKGTCLHYA